MKCARPPRWEAVCLPAKRRGDPTQEEVMGCFVGRGRDGDSPNANRWCSSAMDAARRGGALNRVELDYQVGVSGRPQDNESNQTPVTGGEVGGGRLVTDVPRYVVEDRFGCEVYRGSGSAAEDGSW
jgi:hypothetical protein